MKSFDLFVAHMGEGQGQILTVWLSEALLQLQNLLSAFPKANRWRFEALAVVWSLLVLRWRRWKRSRVRLGLVWATVGLVRGV